MTSRIKVTQEDPYSEASVALVSELTFELEERYRDLGLDGHGLFKPGDALVPRAAFVVARLDDKPVGCGALKPLPEEENVAEIKRMYVAEKARRLGIGYLILAELEKIAASFGYESLRLETGDRQPEAIALYKNYNFTRCANFGPYVGREFSVCFEKKLVAKSA